MGGTVAVIHRTSERTLSMLRWTNSLPAYIYQDAFLRQEPEAVAAFLKNWEDMAADWSANKDTGTFVHPMTSTYAPYPAPMAPDGYGLVVVDAVSRTLLSMQDYCSFGPRGWNEPEYGDDTDPDRSIDGSERAMEIRSLHAAGRIQAYTAYVKDAEHPLLAQAIAALEGTVIDPDGTTFSGQRTTLLRIPGRHSPSAVIEAFAPLRDKVQAERRAHMEQMRAHIVAGGSRTSSMRSDSLPDTPGTEPFSFSNVCSLFYAWIDMSPLSVETFPLSVDGAQAMQRRMQDLGFVFDATDLAGWTSWMDDALEHDD